MFERYTEQARRLLFFARFEASQLGSVSIAVMTLLEQIRLALDRLREHFEL